MRANIRAQNPGATDGHVAELLQEQIAATPQLQQVDEQIAKIEKRSVGYDATVRLEQKRDAIRRQQPTLSDKEVNEVVASDKSEANQTLLRQEKAYKMAKGFKQQ
jgi:hypothetical protein